MNLLQLQHNTVLNHRRGRETARALENQHEADPGLNRMNQKLKEEHGKAAHAVTVSVYIATANGCKLRSAQANRKLIPKEHGEKAAPESFSGLHRVV